MSQAPGKKQQLRVSASAFTPKTNVTTPSKSLSKEAPAFIPSTAAPKAAQPVAQQVTPQVTQQTSQFSQYQQPQQTPVYYYPQQPYFPAQRIQQRPSFYQTQTQPTQPQPQLQQQPTRRVSMGTQPVETVEARSVQLSPAKKPSPKAAEFTPQKLKFESVSKHDEVEIIGTESVVEEKPEEEEEIIVEKPVQVETEIVKEAPEEPNEELKEKEEEITEEIDTDDDSDDLEAEMNAQYNASRAQGETARLQIALSSSVAGIAGIASVDIPSTNTPPISGLATLSIEEQMALYDGISSPSSEKETTESEKLIAKKPEQEEEKETVVVAADDDFEEEETQEDDDVQAFVAGASVGEETPIITSAPSVPAPATKVLEPLLMTMNITEPEKPVVAPIAPIVPEVKEPTLPEKKPMSDLSRLAAKLPSKVEPSSEVKEVAEKKETIKVVSMTDSAPATPHGGSGGNDWRKTGGAHGNDWRAKLKEKREANAIATAPSSPTKEKNLEIETDLEVLAKKQTLNANAGSFTPVVSNIIKYTIEQISNLAPIRGDFTIHKRFNEFIVAEDGKNKKRGGGKKLSADEAASKARLEVTDNAYSVKTSKTNLSDEQVLERQFMSLLNKLSRERYAEVIEEIKALELNSYGIDLICKLIYEKAALEPNFRDLYGDILKDMSRQPAFRGNEAEGIKSIKKTFVNCVRVAFRNRRSEKEKIDSEIAEAEKSKQTKTVMAKMLNELQFKKLGLKQKMRASIMFAGELCKRRILSAFAIRECLQDLSICEEGSPIPVEEDIVCYCELIVIVGKTLAHAKDESRRKILDDALARLENWKLIVPSRSRFMIKDVTELKNNNWEATRRVLQQAQTLTKAGVQMMARQALRDKYLAAHDKKERIQGEGKKAPGRREDAPTARAVDESLIKEALGLIKYFPDDYKTDKALLKDIGASFEKINDKPTGFKVAVDAFLSFKSYNEDMCTQYADLVFGLSRDGHIGGFDAQAIGHICSEEVVGKIDMQLEDNLKFMSMFTILIHSFLRGAKEDKWNRTIKGFQRLFAAISFNRMDPEDYAIKFMKQKLLEVMCQFAKIEGDNANYAMSGVKIDYFNKYFTKDEAEAEILKKVNITITFA
eukprot:TRINITY_DN5573_c0_g1_i1.p1 TRINITY_DN5573_c0_g1~~TRINITY_DN5573_c0_g1_i1.p1  ORF type:complete len:1113 (+),score=430.41 TRINITY_DN5573_c0_g1_i1:131-3469(+)